MNEESVRLIMSYSKIDVRKCEDKNFYIRKSQVYEMQSVRQCTSDRQIRAERSQLWVNL